MIKLPDNPNDRKKVIAAICIGGMVAVYLAVTFGLLPYLARVQERKARVAELENLLWRAQKDLAAMDGNLDRNAALAKDLLAISEVRRHILRPSLGNYLLVAGDIMSSAAGGLRIKPDSASEASAPVLRMPGQGDKKPADPPRFAPYTVNYTATAGMHALARLLRRMETGNPYVTVTRLAVMEQGDTDPEAHFVSMHIQWPVWVDNDHPRRLEAEQIADEERK